MFKIKNSGQIFVEIGEEKRIFDNFNLADHDFSFGLSVKLEDEGILRGRIISGPRPYNWSFFVTDTGEIHLRLGDRVQWKYDVPIGQIENQNSFRIDVRRQAGIIDLLCDGKETRIVLPAKYVIPGNGMRVVSDPVQAMLAPISVQFYDMIIHDYSPSRLPAEKDLNILTMFYGEIFAQMSSSVMFPSLQIHNLNRPFFKDKNIAHHIYCRDSDLKFLDKHLSNLRYLGYDFRIKTVFLPDDMPKNLLRQELVKCLIDSFDQSIANGRCCILAPPDHVFGYGLEAVIRRMKSYDYVVAGHPRIEQETALPALLNGFSDEATPFSGNSQLVRLALETYPHPMVRTGLSKYEPYWWGTRHSDHYSVFFKEPPPLLIDPAADLVNVMLSDTVFGAFETVDHELVDYAFDHGRLKYVLDSNEFFWTELTSSDMYNPTMKNFYWTNASRFFSKNPLIFRGIDDFV